MLARGAGNDYKVTVLQNQKQEKSDTSINALLVVLPTVEDLR